MQFTEETEFNILVAKKYAQKANNARQRGIEFALSYTSIRNLLRAKRCYYTGIELTTPEKGNAIRRPTDLTIERIDSNKGYVKGNVVAACHAANSLKNTFEANHNGMDMKAFLMMAKKISARL